MQRMIERLPTRLAPGTKAELLNTILMARRLPARLTAQGAALMLGFAEHDIPILVRANLLNPLGKPHSNAVKYFATIELESLANDLNWLARATRAVYAHWQGENSRRRGSDDGSASANGLAA
jgi:hypothetical protein